VKQPSVLVVDDDEAVATVLQDILLIAGYPVSVTSSSSVALAAITKGTFDVLIYDLSVNGKRGCFPFLASCLKYHPGLAILLITGFADEETRRQAANLKNVYLRSLFSRLIFSLSYPRYSAEPTFFLRQLKKYSLSNRLAFNPYRLKRQSKTG